MDFYTKYYSQLIDYVVTGVEFDTDEFDGTVFPVLSSIHPHHHREHHDHRLCR
jgi:hypothetical protein